ncbi:MAG: phage shock protein operon transcriptional activator [Planctomycetota bacterium]|nr:MAG: phage shock protein operon transcriptional activator [Planctomycetota bacterium]
MRTLLRAIERVERLDQRNTELQRAIQARFRIVGESPEIQELIAGVKRIAQVPRPVLITGERGTGKELVARAIHFAAFGESQPIVTVNCAAFSDALLESELFGHEKGAFTGADETRQGKFELASGGTLFLDEIAHMSPPFQQKILRVVEYGTFMRVGGQQEQKTSVRIISATNVDLKARIRGGRFLGDLYDRLAFEVIHVPPLRRRSGDVDVLAQHFLDQFSLEIPAFKGKSLARSALRMLRDYSFPGNVRELKNIIERAAYRDTTNEITPEDIGMLPKPRRQDHGAGFQQRVGDYCAQLIHDAMKQSGGNQAQAARILGLTYHQFRHYRRKYTEPT